MTCDPVRIRISTNATTTVSITVLPEPSEEVAVRMLVDALGIDRTAMTADGTATVVIDPVDARNLAIYDCTLQVGSNAPAAAAVEVVETAGTLAVGVTIDGSDVSYCAPSGGGGGSGTVIGVLGESPISSDGNPIEPKISLDEVPGIGGAYNLANITVDDFGRVIAASDGSLPGGGITSVNGDTGPVVVLRGDEIAQSGSEAQTVTAGIEAADAAAAAANELATEAKNDAGQAITDAAEAQESADGAQSTADSAEGAAAAAQSTADGAASAAAGAQSTAATALGQASTNAAAISALDADVVKSIATDPKLTKVSQIVTISEADYANITPATGICYLVTP